MQTAGPLAVAVALAVTAGAEWKNRPENNSGSVRFTVTVTVVALGGVLPDGPNATEIVSDEPENPFSIASFFATAVIVELVWLEFDSKRPALKAVVSTIVCTRCALEYQIAASVPNPITPHNARSVIAVITPIEARSASKAPTRRLNANYRRIPMSSNFLRSISTLSGSEFSKADGVRQVWCTACRIIFSRSGFRPRPIKKSNLLDELVIPLRRSCDILAAVGPPHASKRGLCFMYR